MNQNITVLTGKQIKIRHLLGIWALDKECYPDCFTQFTIKPVFWLIKNPDIYCVIIDNKSGKVIAYALMMPLYESGYKKIVEQGIPDILIPARDLSKVNPGEELYLYFGSIVVSKKWKEGARLLTILGRQYLTLIKKYLDKGASFKCSFADIVSNEGEHIVNHYGMTFLKETNHESRIFQGPISDKLI